MAARRQAAAGRARGEGSFRVDGIARALPTPISRAPSSAELSAADYSAIASLSGRRSIAWRPEALQREIWFAARPWRAASHARARRNCYRQKIVR